MEGRQLVIHMLASTNLAYSHSHTSFMMTPVGGLAKSPLNTQPMTSGMFSMTITPTTQILEEQNSWSSGQPICYKNGDRFIRHFPYPFIFTYFL